LKTILVNVDMKPFFQAVGNGHYLVVKMHGFNRIVSTVFNHAVKRKRVQFFGFEPELTNKAYPPFLFGKYFRHF